MEYIEYILVFGLGLYVGHWFTALFHKLMIGTILEAAGVTHEKLKSMVEEQQVEDEGYERVQIKVEQVGAELYAYRKDDGLFLGQGSTKELLIERLADKLKDVRLMISKEDGADLLGKGKYTFDRDTKQIHND